jgi:hypothetical protein
MYVYIHASYVHVHVEYGLMDDHVGMLLMNNMLCMCVVIVMCLFGKDLLRNMKGTWDSLSINFHLNVC